MDRDDVISTLNVLIETSKDGDEGFPAVRRHGQEPGPEGIFRAEGRTLSRGGRTPAADRPRDERRSGKKQLDQWHDAPLLAQHPRLAFHNERSRDPR